MRFCPPIPVTRIVQCGGNLENFKKPGARNPYWLLLASQYDQLTAGVKKIPLSEAGGAAAVGSPTTPEGDILDKP
jgi:hypothetical protein